MLKKESGVITLYSLNTKNGNRISGEVMVQNKNIIPIIAQTIYAVDQNKQRIANFEANRSRIVVNAGESQYASFTFTKSNELKFQIYADIGKKKPICSKWINLTDER